MDNLSGMAVLGAAGLIVLRGMTCGTDAYGAFLRGAERGMKSALSLLPALCAMMLMTSLMTASGLMELISPLTGPLVRLLRLPEETVPMALLRPLSGSGSLSVLRDIFAACGPDSRAGRAAAVMMGSSETIVYTMTVYLGAAGIKRLPDVVWISLVSYGVGLLVCGWMISCMEMQ